MNYEFDDVGEDEVGIRPEYDEYNEFKYLPNKDETEFCKIDKDCEQYPYLIC